VGSTLPGELELNDPQVLVTRDIVAYGHVAVADPERPYDQNHVLYFGRDGQMESAILARYDFTLPDTFPDSVQVDATTVTGVTLRLFRLQAYASTIDTLGEGEPAPTKVFEVYGLVDTLDTSLYPGPEPAYGALLAAEQDNGSSIFIDLPVAAFLDWYTDGMPGLIIREGMGSDPGLVGYAASELTEYNEIELEHEDTQVGPIIIVTLDESLDLAPLIYVPVADVSTMHPLEPAPASAAGGLVVRTHLRDYPYFAFDLSDLPPGSYINRAELYLAADTLANRGPLTTLVLSEIPVAAVAADTITLDVLDQASAVDGVVSADPRSVPGDEAPWLGFDVTESVQRFANGVFEEPVVWLLTGAEDVFPAYDYSILDPDFYLTRFGFHGTADGDLAPRLRITYTVFSGGGQ